jgi:hypothetical protein
VAVLVAVWSARGAAPAAGPAAVVAVAARAASASAAGVGAWASVATVRPSERTASAVVGPIATSAQPADGGPAIATSARRFDGDVSAIACGHGVVAAVTAAGSSVC